MPSFRYSGVNSAGRSVSGFVEADSPRAARARLREQEVFASSLAEARAEGALPRTIRRGVRAGDLARTMRQLATLLRAGVPLAEAVDTLKRRRSGTALDEALEGVRARIREGASLAAAMTEHPRAFPSIYTGMVEAGEASGALDVVLDRIADHAEGQARLRARAFGALLYPAVMAVVGTTIVLFLLAYVVPQVTRVFAEAKQTLPLPTRLLMAAGDLLAAYGIALLVLVLGAAAVLARLLARDEVRRRFEGILFRLPVIGAVVRDIAVARFAQTLATMVAGGLPLVEALRIAAASCGSLLVGDALRRAERAVFEGGSLATELGRSPLFDPVVVDMIAVGERSGDLEGMLAHASAAVEDQTRQRVDTMATLLEPAMIVAMAGVVLFVVLAIMLPVFEMNRLVH